MKFNIYTCTMIKDEQRYLDEWITHHLNLGFDKIVLFEDFNSSPHDVSKYKDKVILHKIPLCLNDDEMKDYNELKFRQAIAWKCFYRLYKNECDFAIMLDVDEFLMCNDLQNLVDLEHKEISYPWHIHTYSGHINDPHPNEKYSVLDTYWEYDPNSPIYQVKSFFNLHNPELEEITNNYKTFNIPHRLYNEFYYRDQQSYIKHFWSKSLDEYIYKLYNQGVLEDAPYNRSLDKFFDVNHLNKEDFSEYFEKYKDKKIKINLPIV